MAVLAGLLCLRRHRSTELTAEERREQTQVLMQCDVERKSQI